MTYFTAAQLASLEASAATAAEYLDICDSGIPSSRLDPGHYRTCAELLAKIFYAVDARLVFPALLKQSAAAQEMAESVEIERHLTISRLVYYPELAALICRISA